MTSEATAIPAEPEFDLGYYLRVLRRRYLAILVPIVLGVGLGAYLAVWLSPVYRAGATILVESQQIPTGLAQSTVTANAAERIQIIAQRLLSRDNLLKIGREFDLYPGRRLSPSQIVEEMRDAADISRIELGNTVNSQSIGFTVTFEYVNAAIAARVTNEFVDSILQQNLQSRAVRAAETARFFEQQVAELDEALALQGAQIAAFKEENGDALPETLSLRSTSLGRLQAQIAEVAAEIANLRLLRSDLAERVLHGELIVPESDPVAVELDTLKRQLAQARAVFTDSHPDVRLLTGRIEALEGLVAATEPNESEEGAEESPAPSATDRQLATIDQQLETLEARRSELETEAEVIGATIARTPQVEAALNALLRDLDSLQRQYREAKAKQAVAGTGERLEQDRQAERFEVIERASVPTEPVKPDRPRIMAAGSVLGIAAGLGLAVLMELLNKSIHRAQDLETHLRLSALATIPYVVTQKERTRRRRLVWITAALLPLVVALAIVLIHFLVMPLDQLARGVSRRLGI